MLDEKQHRYETRNAAFAILRDRDAMKVKHPHAYVWAGAYIDEGLTMGMPPMVLLSDILHMRAEQHEVWSECIAGGTVYIHLEDCFKCLVSHTVPTITQQCEEPSCPVLARGYPAHAHLYPLPGKPID